MAKREEQDGSRDGDSWRVLKRWQITGMAAMHLTPKRLGNFGVNLGSLEEPWGRIGKKWRSRVADPINQRYCGQHVHPALPKGASRHALARSRITCKLPRQPFGCLGLLSIACAVLFTEVHS